MSDEEVAGSEDEVTAPNPAETSDAPTEQPAEADSDAPLETPAPPAEAGVGAPAEALGPVPEPPPAETLPDAPSAQSPAGLAATELSDAARRAAELREAVEATVDPNAYRVQLPSFEGPLDLLLHLIQQHELDILDIPIAFIAQKYNEYLKLMAELNIDVAAEYLVMAATLTHIKSKMLLPPDPSQADEDAEEAEEEDPRAELIRRLLEYQKYKQAAEDLGNRDLLGRDIFGRGIEAPTVDGPAPLAPIGVFKLLDAFQSVLDRAKKTMDHTIDFERFSITDKINELSGVLSRRPHCRFEELFGEDASRAEVVVTFLALLEMTRLRMIRIEQAGPFETIFVSLAVSPDEESSDALVLPEGIVAPQKLMNAEAPSEAPDAENSDALDEDPDPEALSDGLPATEDADEVEAADEDAEDTEDEDAADSEDTKDEDPADSEDTEDEYAKDAEHDADGVPAEARDAAVASEVQADDAGDAVGAEGSAVPLTPADAAGFEAAGVEVAPGDVLGSLPVDTEGDALEIAEVADVASSEPGSEFRFREDYWGGESDEFASPDEAPEEQASAEGAPAPKVSDLEPVREDAGPPSSPPNDEENPELTGQDEQD